MPPDRALILVPEVARDKPPISSSSLQLPTITCHTVLCGAVRPQILNGSRLTSLAAAVVLANRPHNSGVPVHPLVAELCRDRKQDIGSTHVSHCPCVSWATAVTPALL